MPALTLVEKPAPPSLREKIAEIIDRWEGQSPHYDMLIEELEELIIEEKHRGKTDH